MTKLKFESFPEFIGKPMTELHEHLKKNYEGKLAEKEDLIKENIPEDDNWYHAFGSIFRGWGGNSCVPGVNWGGGELGRSEYWLGSDWFSDYRVVLKETYEYCECKKCEQCGKLLKPAYDKIAKKITGYLFQCPDHPEFYLSVG